MPDTDYTFWENIDSYMAEWKEIDTMLAVNELVIRDEARLNQVLEGSLMEWVRYVRWN